MSQYSIVENMYKLSFLFLLSLCLSGSAFAQSAPYSVSDVLQGKSRYNGYSESCGDNSSSPTKCNTATSDTSKTKSGYENTITSLLARIKALNAQIQNGTTPHPGFYGTTPKPKSCAAITRSLAFGSVDSATADVTALQNILKKAGHYDGEITGYFGQKTKAAVQAFQKAEGIVSSGDEESTGYGMVGEKTRTLLNTKCSKKDIPTVSDKTPYTLADVVSITKQSVDPIPKAIDDEYTRYVVTVTDRTTRTVNIQGNMIGTQKEARFKESGYTGDVPALIAKATAVSVTPKTFILSDVQKITSKVISNVSRVTTQYTITLGKDGRSEVTVTVNALMTASLRDAKFKESGYTGDVPALIAKATAVSVTPKTTFTIKDVKTITSHSVNPSAAIADDEYEEYTITLTDNTVKIVKGHAGRGTERTRALPFRNAGYRGSIDDLLEQVTTPAVLGVSISDTDALLQEFTTEVEVLLSRME